MAFFVAIHQQVWPDRLGELLATIKANLATSRTLQPGRRTTRVFQGLGDPMQLLVLSEWVSEDAFEVFRCSSSFADLTAASGPPPRIEPLEPIRRFERFEQRLGIVACSTITATPGNTSRVQEYLLGDAHREVKGAEGLVLRYVFRSRAQVGRLVLVHGWRSLADLERFRARYSARSELARFGATTDRFTGALAAEFSIHSR